MVNVVLITPSIIAYSILMSRHQNRSTAVGLPLFMWATLKAMLRRYIESGLRQPTVSAGQPARRSKLPAIPKRRQKGHSQLHSGAPVQITSEAYREYRRAP